MFGSLCFGKHYHHQHQHTQTHTDVMGSIEPTNPSNLDSINTAMILRPATQSLRISSIGTNWQKWAKKRREKKNQKRTNDVLYKKNGRCPLPSLYGSPFIHTAFFSSFSYTLWIAPVCATLLPRVWSRNARCVLSAALLFCLLFFSAKCENILRENKTRTRIERKMRKIKSAARNFSSTQNCIIW